MSLLHTCIHHLNYCHLIGTVNQCFWKLTRLRATAHVHGRVHVWLTMTNEPVLLDARLTGHSAHIESYIEV